MAVRTPEEMLSSLRTHLGDDTSDSALTLLEDLTDTMNSLNGNSDGVDWKQRCEETEQRWRQKYRDRFFGKNNDNDNDNNDNDNGDKPKPKPRTFAELFK